jgi:predicted MFS family arabinose efflux permease
MPSLIRNRDYMLLWSGQLVSTMGTASSYVVYPLLILAITGSPEAAGIAGALRTAPYVVFSLPVGALIDRWDRRKVMIYADVGRLLAVATIPAAMLLEALTLWHIYAVVLVEGSLFVFFNIAEVAVLPRVVAREQLPQATAQNEAGFGGANIVGPSFGTFLYQTFGRWAPFGAQIIAYAVSIASLVAIRTDFRTAAPPAHRDLGREIADGMRWLWHKPVIRYMAFLTGGYNLVNAAAPLLLIVLGKQLGASDAEVGLIFSIGGIGGIVGSIIGGGIQRRFTFGQVIVALVWMNAALFALYAVAPSIWVLAAISAAIFVLMPIYNVVQFSYRVALIPDELQGRVNSTFRLLAFGFMPVGAALAGSLIERLGVMPALVVFILWQGVLALATTFNRHIREAPRL